MARLKAGLITRSALMLLIAAILAGCVYHAHYVEPHRIAVETIPIELNPAPIPAMKIIQLSDLHLKKFGSFEQEIVRLVNAEHADLILLTGDYFYQNSIFEQAPNPAFNAQLEDIARFISALRAKHGVYLSRGNHDFGNDKEVSDLFLDRMERLGIRVLANQRETLEINGVRINILGIDMTPFTLSEVADFYVAEQDGNRFLTAGPSLKNSYSHFFPLDELPNWQNYVFTGRLRLEDPDRDGAGVTFYSHFGRGYDRFYRLRWTAKGPTFDFSPHGTHITGKDIYIDFRPSAGNWIRFRIECYTKPDRVEMAARLWQDGHSEPSYWQATAFDSTDRQLRYGTVGLWSAGSGYHDFDDLQVITDEGDTLLQHDFEDIPISGNPWGWVDFVRPKEAIPILTHGIPDTSFTLLLSHNPDFVDVARQYHIDLMLSGHTHGGQIYFPVLIPLALKYLKGICYLRGLFREHETWLYVNRGLGTPFIPFRWMSRPEVTIFYMSGTPRD